VNGQEVPHLARLHADGSLDLTFRPPMVPLSQFRRHRVPVHSLASAAAPRSPAPANVLKQPLPTVVITSLTMNPSGARVRFNGAGGRKYILQAAASLGGTNWVNVTTNFANADGNGTLLDPDANRFPMRFYRLATE
jgi:hypothetical protein